MPLASGTRVGPYQVVAPIGHGGMGEVYRARDTRLERDVAIKILPDSFAHDPERVARFTREAKTLAALNHPHIAQIYGLEESNPSTDSGQAGISALVMELVDGATLADRIAQGPIPLVHPVLGSGYGYDVTADGQRFLVNTAPQQIADVPFAVVVNWAAGVQK